MTINVTVTVLLPVVVHLTTDVPDDFDPETGEPSQLGWSVRECDADADVGEVCENADFDTLAEWDREALAAIRAARAGEP